MLHNDTSTLSILSGQQAHSRHKALIQAALARKNRASTTDSTTSSNQDNTIKSINNGDSKPVKNNELLSKEASVQTFHWLLEHYTLRTSNRLTQHAEKALGEIALTIDLTMLDSRTRNYIATLQRHGMDAEYQPSHPDARLSVLTAMMIIQSAIPRHYSEIPWSMLERAIHLWDRLHYSYLTLMKHALVKPSVSHLDNNWTRNDDYQFVAMALRRELALHILAEKWFNNTNYHEMIDRLFSSNATQNEYIKLKEQIEHNLLYSHDSEVHFIASAPNQPFIPLNNNDNIRLELMRLMETITEYARQHSIDGNDQEAIKRVMECPAYVQALERVSWSSIRRTIRNQLAWLFEQLPLQYNYSDTFLHALQVIGITKEDDVITKITKWSIWNCKQHSKMMADVKNSNIPMNSQPLVKKLTPTSKANDSNDTKIMNHTTTEHIRCISNIHSSKENIKTTQHRNANTNKNDNNNDDRIEYQASATSRYSINDSTRSVTTSLETPMKRMRINTNESHKT